MPVKKPVLFVDFKKHLSGIREEIDAAVSRVLESGWYVLGREGEGFETSFAEYLGAGAAVGCASGTDALALALMALGVGPGDEVVTVPNTALPTATAISMTGAVPVFADVDERSLLMDPERLEAALTERTRAVVPVHLYGNPADMDPILALARTRGVHVVEDACQAHGALYRGKKVGTLGDAGCFSFYPTKNLGAFGDGGMVVTNDEGLADKLRLLRNYGQRDRYHHEVPGMNSRLDEVQAAILRVKLSRLDAWNGARREIGDRYTAAFSGLPLDPVAEIPQARGVRHLYVVRSRRRDDLRAFLEEQGVQAWVHYPIPVHLQQAYAGLGLAEGAFPVAERAAQEVLSLPVYPELAPEDQETVIRAVKEFFS